MSYTLVLVNDAGQKSGATLAAWPLKVNDDTRLSYLHDDSVDLRVFPQLRGRVLKLTDRHGEAEAELNFNSSDDKRTYAQYRLQVVGANPDDVKALVAKMEAMLGLDKLKVNTKRFVLPDIKSFWGRAKYVLRWLCYGVASEISDEA